MWSLSCPAPLGPVSTTCLPFPFGRKRTRSALLVAIRELAAVEQTLGERNIYHKNLQNVTYVTADVAGEVESPIYAILAMNKELAGLDGRDFGGTRPIYPNL